jgi:hypothetical protein
MKKRLEKFRGALEPGDIVRLIGDKTGQRMTIASIIGEVADVRWFISGACLTSQAVPLAALKRVAALKRAQ